MWSCPICKLPLATASGSLHCTNNHSFDVAKEGYVNLMTRRVPRMAGDSLAMLGARRAFLEAGYYQPLLKKLGELVSGDGVVLDAGCGEGYYLGNLAHQHPQATFLGTDISKDAVRLAASKWGGAEFAVADTNTHLPLASGVVDIVLDIFAPRNVAEFARILKPSGRLIVVQPTPQHLAELRSVLPLLDIESDKRQQTVERLASHFLLCDEQVLTFPIILPPSELLNLVGMMPSARHLALGWQEQIIGSTTTTTSFDLLEFSKR